MGVTGKEMAARPRTEPTSLSAPARALRAWGVGVLAAAILVSAAALAYTSVQPTERAASRTITDIELEEDVTLQSITAQPGFRPVLRKVRSVPVAVRLVASPRRSGTAGRTNRPPSGNRGGAGPGTRRPGGGTSVRPPGGGGGGGSKPPTRATQPTPATPAPTTPAPAPEQPSPSVSVVTIPPQAVGPVGVPETAVGPQAPVHPPAHGLGVPPGLL